MKFKNILIPVIIFIILLIILEGFFRIIEGSPVFKLNIPIPSIAPKNLEKKAADLSAKINSEYLTTELYKRDPIIKERLELQKTAQDIRPTLRNDNMNADLRIYNINYLNQVYCTGEKEYTKNNFDPYDEWVYTYGSYDHNPYPVYTFVSNSSGIKESNKTQFYNFGWGGDKIELQKPDHVIRIAFVGGSTSQQMGSCNWTYPDYIGAWLNHWAKEQQYNVRFEIINTGRVAQTSPDFAAIVKYELLAIDPDLVIYYEGRNQFYFNELINDPAKSTPQNLKKKYAHPSTNSVMIQKIKYVLNRFQKEKPDLSHNNLNITLPPKINYNSPNPYNPNLPISLPQIVKDLDTMKYYLDSIDSELILTSFAMMVDQEIEYSPLVNQSIIDYWNHDYPNVSWKSIQTLNRLHNNVFQQYAKINELDFIKVDELLTLEPDLFLDGIHLYCEGMKYKSWIILQDLLPTIKDKIDHKILPKAGKNTFSKHPYIMDNYDKVNLDCNSISNYIASKKLK